MHSRWATTAHRHLHTISGVAGAAHFPSTNASTDATPCGEHGQHQARVHACVVAARVPDGSGLLAEGRLLCRLTCHALPPPGGAFHQQRQEGQEDTLSLAKQHPTTQQAHPLARSPQHFRYGVRGETRHEG